MYRERIFFVVDRDQKFKTTERMRKVGADSSSFHVWPGSEKIGIRIRTAKHVVLFKISFRATKTGMTGVSGNTKQMNMSNTSKVHLKTVAMRLTRKPIPQLITDTKHYLASMTGNAFFPSPIPALPVISAVLNLVESSYALSLTRVKGSASKLQTDVKALSIDLRALAVYVETIANKDPDHAEEIIATGGMLIKKPSRTKPKNFSVKLGKLNGEVLLNNKASLRGIYIYDLSTDPNLAEASWKRIYIGSKVKFSKDGLNSGTKYFFRAASIVKNVQSNYSPVLSLVVQ
jgi:hypothetical protein